MAKLEGLRAILFDLGGTLDGPGVPWVERFAAAYRAAGIDLPPDRINEAVGFGTRQAYRTPQVAGFGLRQTVTFHVTNQFAHLGIENARAADAIGARFVTETEQALADSRALLARWGRRFALGVVSNFYGNAARILDAAQLAPLLGAIIDSSVVGVSKPDPRIFELALDRLHVRAADALFVGDSLSQDITPARTAGLRTAWLHGAHTASPDAADVLLRSLSDLDAVLAA
jgi:putative hydrolase of the HAD superfamily